MAAIVFVDVETSGLDLVEHSIIQLAAIAVDAETGEELDTFERKLLFNQEKADKEALRLNHFDKQVWEDDGKAPLQVCAEFAGWLKPYLSIECISKKSGRPYQVARLAGYNSAGFDAPRLQALFKQWGVFLPAHPMTLDVMQRALWFFHEAGLLNGTNKPLSLKLEDACKWFGVEIPGAHDALADVRATAKLAAALKEGL